MIDGAAECSKSYISSYIVGGVSPEAEIPSAHFLGGWKGAAPPQLEEQNVTS